MYSPAPSFLFEPKKVSEEIEMGKNAKIDLVEVDKHRNVQNSVWMEITQAYFPILQQIPQERMYRKS